MITDFNFPRLSLQFQGYIGTEFTITATMNMP